MWFTFVRNPWDRLVSAFSYLYPRFKKEHGTFENWLTHIKHVADTTGHAEGSHFLPQSDYINDKVSFVGRFENLDEDWNKLRPLINADDVEIPRLNASKERKNKHYSLYYNSKTQKMIEDMYTDDIDMF